MQDVLPFVIPVVGLGVGVLIGRAMNKRRQDQMNRVVREIKEEGRHSPCSASNGVPIRPSLPRLTIEEYREAMEGIIRGHENSTP